MQDITIRRFVDDDAQITRLIKKAGWNIRQLRGQLSVIHRLASDKNGRVLVAVAEGELLGYISAEFYEWNRLGQIQGLIVDNQWRGQGIATRLVREIEKFMKRKWARGIHVDTPVNNELGRKFYTWLGYQEDCIRSEYYGPSSDAVVYLYLFR
jgi:ribosomal protein S18 acetylase RimI-like enzyme